MKKEFAVAATLLITSLALSYWVSLPVSDSDESKEWVTIDSKAITAISYKSPTKSVDIKPMGEEGFWIDTTEQVAVKPAVVVPTPAASPSPASPSHQQASVTPTPSPSATPEITPTKEVSAAFKGSERMTELLSALKPFLATRLIGSAKKLDLTEFGLDEKAPRFTVTTKAGEALALKIGKRSYGSRNTFALDEKSEQVLLVDSGAFELLENAKAQLFERRIADKELSEFKKLKIIAQGREKALTQAEKDANGEPAWRVDEDASLSKPHYKSWLDNIAKMRVQRFATDAEAKIITATPAFLEIAFIDGDKEHDRLEFRKILAGSLAEEKDPSFWVLSKFLGTAAKVSVNRMSVFEHDLEGIIATQAE